MGSPLPTLTEKLINFLDAKFGTPAHGNPLGTKAREVKLGSRLAQLDSLKSGVATIANGQTSVTLDTTALGGEFDGKPAVASIAESGSSALYITSVEWDGSDQLVISVDQDPGQDLSVAWQVDAR